MIKDKDGVPLKYGDTIRNVAGGRHGVHRFCYEYKGSAKGEYCDNVVYKKKCPCCGYRMVNAKVNRT